MRKLKLAGPKPAATRSAVGRRLIAALALAPLVVFTSASSAPAASADADIRWYRHTFWSNASHTTIVGAADGYCDGDYIMVTGYQTPYTTIRYFTMCP